MANPNLSSYSREDYEGAGPEDESLAGNADIADTVDSGIEDTDGLGDVLEAGEVIGQAGSELADAEKTVEDAPVEEVNASTVEAWSRMTDSIRNRLGIQLSGMSKEYFSRENFGTSADREAVRGQFTKEDLGGTLKGWWNQLIAFLKRCLDSVVTWVTSFFNSAKGLKKQAEEVKKLCEDRLNEKDFEKKTVKISNGVGRALLSRGGKSIDPVDVLKHLDADIALSNTVSGAVAKAMTAVTTASEALGTANNSLANKLADVERLFTTDETFTYNLGFARIVVKGKKEELTRTVTYDKSSSNAKEFNPVVIWPASGVAICDKIIALAGKWIDDKSVKELKEKLSESIKAVQKEAKENNGSTKTELSRLIRGIQQLTTSSISMFHKDRNQMVRTCRAALAYTRASQLEIKSKSKD